MRDLEVRREQVKLAYDQLYSSASKAKSSFDAIMDAAVKIRGSLGGVFGPIVGGLLDLYFAIKTDDRLSSIRAEAERRNYIGSLPSAELVPPKQVDQATPPKQVDQATPPKQVDQATPPKQVEQATPPKQVEQATPPKQTAAVIVPQSQAIVQEAHEALRAIGHTKQDAQRLIDQLLSTTKQTFGTVQDLILALHARPQQKRDQQSGTLTTPPAPIPVKADPVAPPVPKSTVPVAPPVPAPVKVDLVAPPVPKSTVPVAPPVPAPVKVDLVAPPVPAPVKVDPVTPPVPKSATPVVPPAPMPVKVDPVTPPAPVKVDLVAPPVPKSADPVPPSPIKVDDQHKADGGPVRPVPGIPPDADEVPVRAQAGEFVVRKDAAQDPANRMTLDRMNAGHYAKGGTVSESLWDAVGTQAHRMSDLNDFEKQVKKRLGTMRYSEVPAVVPHDSLGIPRNQMPQIPPDLFPAFMERLKEQGVESEMTRVPVGDMRPSQGEIGLEKIAKNSLKSEKKLGKKTIVVSSDGYVVDGHHGWAGALIGQGKDFEMQTLKINMPIKDLLAAARSQPGVFYKEVGMAKGGQVGMAKGGEVPIRATAGEYIVNKDAARNPDNRRTLETMNSRHYAGGGIVAGPPPARPVAGPPPARPVDGVASGEPPIKPRKMPKEAAMAMDQPASPAPVSDPLGPVLAAVHPVFAIVQMAKQVADAVAAEGRSAVKSISGSAIAVANADASVPASMRAIADSTKVVTDKFGLIGAVVDESIRSFADLTSAIDGTAERYGEFSPAIAQAQAQAEIRQMLGDMRRSQEAGPELARYLQQQTALQQKFEDIKIKLLLKILPLVTAIASAVENAVNAGESIGPSLLAIASPLTAIAEMARLIARTQEDASRPPVIDPTSLIINLNPGTFSSSTPGPGLMLPPST